MKEYLTKYSDQATGRCENCGESTDKDELEEYDGLCQRCAWLKY